MGDLISTVKEGAASGAGASEPEAAEAMMGKGSGRGESEVWSSPEMRAA